MIRRRKGPALIQIKDFSIAATSYAHAAVRTADIAENLYGAFILEVINPPRILTAAGASVASEAILRRRIAKAVRERVNARVVGGIVLSACRSGFQQSCGTANRLRCLGFRGAVCAEYR
jgi:hypothetical protein